MFRELITDEPASPPVDLTGEAWIQSMDQYHRWYRRSIDDPEGFWAEMAEDFYWHRKWTTVRAFDFKDEIDIKFFEGGQTNIVYNALDRQVATHREDKVALIWEGNEPGDVKKFTYAQLKNLSGRFANVLKSRGVKKGDRVCIFMPMIPELVISMLACARIGAIHSVVFAAFSAGSLSDRILDSGCSVLVTADGVFRGKKHVNLKETADRALEIAAERGHRVPHSIVCRRLGASQPVPMKDGRDEWWHDVMAESSAECPVEWMDAEDPLFILYTSGSTGKPKGVLHTTAGYMVFAAKTFKHVFDYHDNDIFWCTADIGWITGHTYLVYGPLLNGATTVMFEGTPTYPDPGRFWDVVDQHKVSIFYTAPTAIRALASAGDQHVNSRKLESLRLLGTVGEPINPKAWQWYHRVVGKARLPIVDTWWQTETGGVLISPLPGATPLKPGSATLPYFGVNPVLLDDDGREVRGPGTGVLCLKEPWPGMARTLYDDHDRFKEVYFNKYPGYYFTGDGARRDEDGYYWITGRIDDVINVSGHRLGTAEVESALQSHPAVAEAAVVGYPHEIKGQGIYAYVALTAGVDKSSVLEKELIDHVRSEIGPIAAPDIVHWVEGLPKTRSGKIMRRILRKIATKEWEQIGDTSTLADPSVVDRLTGGTCS